MNITHLIVLKRGTLGGGPASSPWGYDVMLDDELAGHVGSLTDAEAFAEGLACGIVAMGGDAEISRAGSKPFPPEVFPTKLTR